MTCTKHRRGSLISLPHPTVKRWNKSQRGSPLFLLAIKRNHKPLTQRIIYGSPPRIFSMRVDMATNNETNRIL